MLFRPGLGGQMSGSLNGMVASHNRYGGYLRNRSIPVNPNTQRQSFIRTLMATYSQKWQNDLTTAQRNQWKVYANAIPWVNGLGDPSHITGMNMFVRTNVAMIQAGGTEVLDGPAILSLPETDPAFNVEASEATQKITVIFTSALDWCSENNAHLLISSGQPMPATRDFYGSPWRFAEPIHGNAGAPPVSPKTITCPYTFQQGQRLWVRARIIRADGRLSYFFRDDCTTGA